MTQGIAPWFAPPELSGDVLRRRARALWLVSWPLLGVVTVVLGIAVLVEPDTFGRRTGTVAIVAALVAILHLISRSGRPTLASWIFVIGLAIIVTQRAWITGGIHAPVAVFYALFIVMGGVLLDTRGGVVTALVCFVGALVLTVGESKLWLTPLAGAGRPIAAFVFCVLAIGIALVLQMLMSFTMRRNVREADAVQMLVHDMRSPLQVVSAHLELLRAETEGEAAENVEGALGGAAELERMTSSLLDVSRLEAGRMPVRRVPTDIAALANSVVTSMRILQPARTMLVESKDAASCECDPDLMRRVLENLVGNAMKHTDANAAVRVVISRTSDAVRIDVHDEGPGISPAQRAVMFEPFSSDDPRAANGRESWGLGLAFCRLALQAQGGTIRVEDGKPKGSVFVVELPR